MDIPDLVFTVIVILAIGWMVWTLVAKLRDSIKAIPDQVMERIGKPLADDERQEFIGMIKEALAQHHEVRVKKLRETWPTFESLDHKHKKPKATRKRVRRDAL